MKMEGRENIQKKGKERRLMKEGRMEEQILIK
jgi:hypothetical protein